MSYADYTQRVIDKNLNGMERYKAEIHRKSARAHSVLHLGCGHDLGEVNHLFAPKVEVHGIDPDLVALQSYPGDAWHANAGAMPFGDGAFDMVFSEYVLEHLSEPETVFSEVSRVLASGGAFISVAPNLWSYKSIVASLTPLRVHRVAVRWLRQDSSREAEDVYPTVFKANTGAAIRLLALEAGLTLEHLEYVDNGPTWFQRIPVLFELGRCWHTSLKLSFLAGLRCNIISVLSKPGTESPVAFTIRCINCGTQPMSKLHNGFTCLTCGNKYLRKNGVMRVLPLDS